MIKLSLPDIVTRFDSSVSMKTNKGYEPDLKDYSDIFSGGKTMLYGVSIEYVP